MLPIIIGSFVFFRSRIILAFWIFLIYGFLTDRALMAYVLSESHTENGLIVAVFIHNFYSLVDSVFLFMLLSYFTRNAKWRAALQALALLMPPAWYVSYFLIKSAWFVQSTLSSVFDPGYEILLAICSAAILLEMTNASYGPLSRSRLWLCIGIFFYNFCVFFIHAFLDDAIIKDIWFLNSTLNIITMVIYSIGFASAIRDKVAIS